MPQVLFATATDTCRSLCVEYSKYTICMYFAFKRICLLSGIVFSHNRFPSGMKNQTLLKLQLHSIQRASFCHYADDSYNHLLVLNAVVRCKAAFLFSFTCSEFLFQFSYLIYRNVPGFLVPSRDLSVRQVFHFSKHEMNFITINYIVDFSQQWAVECSLFCLVLRLLRKNSWSVPIHTKVNNNGAPSPTPRSSSAL